MWLQKIKMFFNPLTDWFDLAIMFVAIFLAVVVAHVLYYHWRFRHSCGEEKIEMYYEVKWWVKAKRSLLMALGCAVFIKCFILYYSFH